MSSLGIHFFQNKAIQLLTVLIALWSSALGNNSGVFSEADSLYYPSETWLETKDLNSAGWSAALLDEAEDYTRNLNTEAVVVVHKGKIVRKWGNVERKLKCHSVRKSFLSALYGVFVDKGIIDLKSKLEELNIDDNTPSLSKEERQATIEMLLKARSGIYHPALYETKSMAAKRPERHSHTPNTFWYYNNWDFNALGTIFEKETDISIFDAFKDYIANPIGMQNFDPKIDCQYYKGSASIHPAYLFEMNAMDMARFGLLFARGGKWENKQIISSEWIEASFTSYSDAGRNGGYGYLWWVAEDGKHFSGTDAPEGLITARGKGGQVIAIIPEMDLVVVHRVNTSVRGNSVSYSKFGQLLSKILKAYKQ
ncbi:MAG TPA: serine hydrolase [Sphingobacterium sp.]|nr:serine hydrolase [Sphingobacterium sp.]